MIEFQQKKRIRKILYSPIVLIILFIIFVILTRSLWGVYEKERISSENLSKEKTELEKLSLREKDLASALEYLKTDQGIENEIRSKFRVVREGEKVAVIVGEEATNIKEQLPTVSTTTPSLWYKILNWFD